MTRSEEFEELRPLLFSIAYRILGTVSEAEDAVQESWLRYETSQTQVEAPKAFLSAVVTRISLDVLKSARVRRETYGEPWFPEPLLTDPYQDPGRSAELADSISMAALVLLERLSPLERAVFVLRDVFGFGYAEIAAAIGRSEAACRQLIVRARDHVAAGRPRFEADKKARQELADRFFRAFESGQVDALQALLAADVVVQADGGGKGPQWGSGTVGRANVARAFAATVVPFLHIGGVLEQQEVNGQPGILFRDPAGHIVGVMALDILDGQIQAIRAVSNPDKLTHLGPIGDAWDVRREMNQARRSPNL
ncbi:RNA polymerase sigma-70 factor [Kribbella sp. NBC_00709]|uniref:RNA polymerase sigma-70 factor n=1 Tax=Kribbella sp. NBC_00709 TaxID=2975972 RepID=UPI002E27E6BA|nr:RNA polymerase sigma-70 factor [Kribbella sp. NBC_00709]